MGGWYGWSLTEDQTGEVQRDEGETCGFEHDSSSSGVRLARCGGRKSPVSAPVPVTSGRDETQFIRATCLTTPAQKLTTQAASLSRPASPGTDYPEELLTRTRRGRRETTAVVWGKKGSVKQRLLNYSGTSTRKSLSPSQLLTDHHNASPVLSFILSSGR